jgi:predicted lysophospholipase L1 biosynthesis ABC-type transport system permease subunit
MTRRSFIRVLLSLLLLLSQQMAVSHAMTHWAGSREGATRLLKAAGQQDERGVSAAFAQDQTCEQCLAFAQIASALGSQPRGFAADSSATCATGPSATQPGCARTTCVFQSRAPPCFA